MKNGIIIRKSRVEDIDDINSIFDSARQYMRANNNMTQWNNSYPSIDDINRDIAFGNSFVGQDNKGEIIFTFTFIIGEDPTYKVIKNGDWLNEDPYGTIHRIASNGKVGGVLKMACEYCFNHIDNIRIDTHKDNKPMLKALNNLGFKKCGNIICRDGSPRIAFQKIKDMDLKEIWDKMISGEEYDATHSGLRDLLQQTRMKLWEFNSLHPDQTEQMNEILRGLFGSIGKRFIINQPFKCDYGCNIFLGEDCFINFNCTILDEAKVIIGDNAFLGPNVSIYTACHPIEPERRNQFKEWAEPVTIGNNVWIGGDVTILPGLTIGDNVTIGAGSVVTKSIPSNVVIGGNPAKIIKKIN